MRVIVNGKFLTQNITGVQRFAREILLELDKLVEKGSVMIAAPKGDYKIPDGVTELESYTLTSTDLDSLTIPSSVKIIPSNFSNWCEKS